MGNKHIVRLCIRSIRKPGLSIADAYMILLERTDEKAEVRAYSESGALVGLIPYEEALSILAG